MEEAVKEQMLFKRSMRTVLLLSFLYAAAGNVWMYAAYFNSGIVENSYLICAGMVLVFAMPIVKWFRNRHWYFPIFIFLFWIPFSVLLAYVLSQILPLSQQNTDFGLLLVYYLILNVLVMLVGLGLGMLVNVCWMLWDRYN
ncbi:hypothetical protein [Paenibacillus sinopodophylli]|uniref:hypothetical protein n=1 Tax=Paenibacillus sinopodophylli TaxID=1837342 RepID=UPI00110D2111|nr:hypothetical protein [Paenibacillus sinopodophylli]